MILEPVNSCRAPRLASNQSRCGEAPGKPFSHWRRILLARIAQKQTVENAYNAAVDAAEDQTLPGLRDALIQILGQTTNS